MKQNIWLVYGLDDDAEYSDMDFVYDVCLTEAAAKKSVNEARIEHENTDFWYDKCEAHD